MVPSRDRLAPRTDFVWPGTGPTSKVARAALRLTSRLMPPEQGRRWLAEAIGSLIEIGPKRRAAATRSYFRTAPVVIAATWLQYVAGRAQILAADEQREPVIRAIAFAVLLGIVTLVAWETIVQAPDLNGIGVFCTVMVSGYAISLFAPAALYRQPRSAGMEPEIVIVIAAYSSGDGIANAIDAWMRMDYPREKFKIVAVNDGSPDDTWPQMLQAAGRYPPGTVRCIDLKGRCRGKRAAVAAGVRATSAEILVLADADILPSADGAMQLVQVFADPKVGAVSGLTHVHNAKANALTRMQQTRLYVSCQLLQAAGSVAGAVAFPAQFVAYRRSAVLPVLQDWEHQHFLGRQCRIGADNSLTNMILRKGWKTVYHSGAVASLEAPEEYHHFVRQELRYKMSRLRERLILISHIWRTRPLAFPAALIQTLAGLTPIAMLYNLLWHNSSSSLPPILCAIVLYIAASAYSLLYPAQRNDGLWKWAIFGTLLYAALSPQVMWAAARIRERRWVGHIRSS